MEVLAGSRPSSGTTGGVSAPRPLSQIVAGLAPKPKTTVAHAVEQRERDVQQARVEQQAKQVAIANEYRRIRQQHAVAQKRAEAAEAQAKAAQEEQQRQEEERRQQEEEAERVAVAAQEAKEEKERQEAKRLQDEGYIAFKKKNIKYHARTNAGAFAVVRQPTCVDAYRALCLKYPDDDLRTVLANNK